MRFLRSFESDYGITNADIFIALAWYMLTVLLGLAVMVIVYGIIIYTFTAQSTRFL
ncbi:MAG: hypothetical protein IPG00_10735 [Saprospiraceae bacterium]|nr:hypothetical protein [Saprospiraceae bacterium]